MQNTIINNSLLDREKPSVINAITNWKQHVRGIIMKKTLFMLLALVTGPALADTITSSGYVSGNSYTSTSGDCLTITASNVVLTNLIVGPCAGAGVVIQGSNVQLVNSYIHDTTGVGVLAQGTNTLVTGNVIDRVATGVYAVNAQSVSVVFNTFSTMNGPMPRGQCVQFNAVSGVGNQIIGNQCAGATSDSFNIYESSGTALSPILIENNTSTGGSTMASAAGIVLGDEGGFYQTAIGNTLINTGGVGLAIAGGSYMTAIRNTIIGVQAPWTNVGLYVWGQGTGVPCSDEVVLGNAITWVNSAGESNPRWNGGNCNVITPFAAW